jgi:hypothetical protein
MITMLLEWQSVQNVAAQPLGRRHAAVSLMVDSLSENTARCMTISTHPFWLHPTGSMLHSLPIVATAVLAQVLEHVPHAAVAVGALMERSWTLNWI